MNDGLPELTPELLDELEEEGLTSARGHLVYGTIAHTEGKELLALVAAARELDVLASRHEGLFSAYCDIGKELHGVRAERDALKARVGELETPELTEG